jgi:hypothetical protein
MATTATPPSPDSPPSENTEPRARTHHRRRWAWLAMHVVLPGLLLVLAPVCVGLVGAGVLRATGWAIENWWVFVILIGFLLFSGTRFSTGGGGFELAYSIDVFSGLADALRPLLPSLRTNGGGGGPPPNWLRWLLAAVLGAAGLGVLGFVAWRINVMGWIMRHNLLVSIILVIAVLQSALHRSARQKLSWNKLADPWLKFNGIGVIGVGGIGVLGATKTATVIVEAVVASPYLDLQALTNLYLAALVLVGAATLLANVGRTRAEKEEEYKPVRWFIPAFGLAWLGSVLVFAIFFDSVLLSFLANSALPPRG